MLFFNLHCSLAHRHRNERRGGFPDWGAGASFAKAEIKGWRKNRMAADLQRIVFYWTQKGLTLVKEYYSTDKLNFIHIERYTTFWGSCGAIRWFVGLPTRRVIAPQFFFTFGPTLGSSCLLDSGSILKSSLQINISHMTVCKEWTRWQGVPLFYMIVGYWLWLMQ